MAGGKGALALAKGTFSEFSKDEATWKAAALSYFTVFALAPLLVLLLQVASFVWDPSQVRDALTGQFQAVMGREVARQVQTMMSSAEQRTDGSGLRLVLSIAGLVFGATGAFAALQTALNRAWEVEPDPKRGGIRNFLTKRIMSLGMVLAIAFLLLVSLAVTAGLTIAGAALFGGFGSVVARVLNFALTFGVITVLFAAMFKVLPDAIVEWRDVWAGAIATSLLFMIGKTLIGLYIGTSDPGSTFGAAGSLAVLLVWIYYAAVILLLGAEFTQVWARAHGREIEPEEGAVRFMQVKRHVRDPSDAHGLNSEGGERMHHNPKIEEARREIETTREQTSETIAAIQSEVSERAQRVKEKVNPVNVVREHPLPAIAAAVVAGAALSATRADRKAADATVKATKQAPSALAEGAHRIADAASERLHGDGSNDGAEEKSGSTDGFVGRMKARATGVVESQARELEREMRRAANEIGGT